MEQCSLTSLLSAIAQGLLTGVQIFKAVFLPSFRDISLIDFGMLAYTRSQKQSLTLHYTRREDL